MANDPELDLELPPATVAVPPPLQPADYKAVLDQLYDGVYFVDRNRTITYWNGGAERITGYRAEQVVGRCCADNILMHVSEDGRRLCQQGCPLSASMGDGTPRVARVYLQHAAGHRVPVQVRVAPLRGPDGTILGAVESFSDNSAMVHIERRMSELHQASLEDALTGVGNRRLLGLRLQAALDEYASAGTPCAVLMIDIDHFKQVNDVHGHLVGDQVLRMVASTLRSNVRTRDAVARWGGEEFVVLGNGVEPGQVERIANKLRRLVATSHWQGRDGEAHAVTVSLGVALARAGDTPETIIARADGLLYASKMAGRDRVTCETD